MMIMFDSIAHVNFEVPETTICGTRGEADAIISALEDYLDDHHFVTVDYLCKLLDKPTCDSMEYYGWKDLGGALIYRDRNGYALTLPEPIQLSDRIGIVEERRKRKMHENDYLDALTYAWKYESGPYYKHETPPIGTVTEKTVSDEGFSFTVTVDSEGFQKLYVVSMGYYPEKIIHDGPATIVFWPDGSKTVVKCSENDIYDPFDAFTAALTKKIYGTTSSIKTMLKKVTVEQKKE